MLSDAMRFAVAMAVGPDQNRHDALCAALLSRSQGSEGESIRTIAARTHVDRRTVKADLDRFVSVWKWCAAGLEPPVAPEVAKLSLA